MSRGSAGDMFAVLGKIAERKILEARERGDFDNLPGRGEPLNLDDDAAVPEELRMAYKILKNAGCTPPEVMLKQEIIQLEDMLAGIEDEQEKYRQLKKLNFLIMKLNEMRRCPVEFEENQRYLDKIVSRMSLAPKKKPSGGTGQAER